MDRKTCADGSSSGSDSAADQQTVRSRLPVVALAPISNFPGPSPSVKSANLLSDGLLLLGGRDISTRVLYTRACPQVSPNPMASWGLFCRFPWLVGRGQATLACLYQAYCVGSGQPYPGPFRVPPRRRLERPLSVSGGAPASRELWARRGVTGPLSCSVSGPRSPPRPASIYKKHAPEPWVRYLHRCHRKVHSLHPKPEGLQAIRSTTRSTPPPQKGRPREAGPRLVPAVWCC